MTVNQVELTGNTLFSTKALRAALADEMGRSLDLAGLRTMAQRVSALYKGNRYPLPRELKSGRVIETGLLTRNLLVLDDQPVVKIHPLARPGQETGTGDLIVTVTPTPTVRFDIGYDNHGARYTGVNRLRPNAQFDSPHSLGDQVLLREVYSDENLRLGSLSYGRPIGHLGLHATANASRPSHSLGTDFASLDAPGTADTASLTLSYALVRLTTSNSILETSLQRKQLRDIQCAVRSHERQSIQSLLLSLDGLKSKE